MKKKIIKLLSYYITIIIVIVGLLVYYYNKSRNIIYKTEERVNFNLNEQYKNLKCRSIYLNYYILKITKDLDIDSSNDSISNKNKKPLKRIPNRILYYLKKFFRSLPNDYESYAKLIISRNFYEYIFEEYIPQYDDPRQGYKKFTHNKWSDFNLFDKDGNPTANFENAKYAKGYYKARNYKVILLISLVFPKEVWLEKFITINSGKIMGLGDALIFIKYLGSCLEGNKEKLAYFISVLEKFTEREALAFWYGFWVSMDGWRYQDYYEGLMPKLPKKMKDIATEAALATGHGLVFDKLDDIEPYFCQAPEQGVLITENYMFIWDGEDQYLCDECKEKKELILSKVNNKS